MNYKLSREAEKDLIRIYQYGLANFGELQADKYFYSFFSQFEIICKQPYGFPQVDNIRFGYRKCVCGVDSIYYKINQNEIEIMAIVGRQDYDYLKKPKKLLSILRKKKRRFFKNLTLKCHDLLQSY